MIERVVGERWDGLAGLRVRSLIAGERGMPVVVLVHGLGLAADSLADMARHLGVAHRVLAPDLPGFGESDHPRRPLNIGGLADALRRWCDRLSLDGVILVGNSYGAQVVAELAAREAEERIERRIAAAIVLIGPTCDPDARSLIAQVRRWRQNAAGDAGSGSVAALVEPYLKAGIGRVIRTARAATKHRIEDRLPAVDVPTLIIAGERDAISPLSWNRRLAELAPRAELRVVDGGGHSMHGSHPIRLADLVADFVRRVRPAPGPRARRARSGVRRTR